MRTVGRGLRVRRDGGEIEILDSRAPPEIGMEVSIYVDESEAKKLIDELQAAVAEGELDE